MAARWCYDWLLARARDPADIVTYAFAGAIDTSAAVLPASCRLGLEPARFAVLLAHYFPRATEEVLPFPDETGCSSLRNDEFGDLLQLLRDHGSRQDEENEWLAHAVAAACLGGNHLWQDLGLPNRQALSGLLRDHFSSLFAKNTGNMKWKKFFYKRLCERAELSLCPAPSCRECADYAACFGPEDGAPLHRQATAVSL